MTEPHELKLKYRGSSDLKNRPKVYFCATERDFWLYFDSISDELLGTINNCVIYYDDGAGEVVSEQTREFELSQMNLFVIPVTAELLSGEESRATAEVHTAMAMRIAVLPIMQESGLDKKYSELFGTLQYLDRFTVDDTAIPYERKLNAFLRSVFVNADEVKRVQSAFRTYIFLSYRKKDREHANALMRRIHGVEGCDDVAIWYDEYLTPGESFDTSIERALDKCELFTLAVTPNLVNEKNYVMTTEYPMARGKGKKIIALECLPTDPAELKALYENVPDAVDVNDEGLLSLTLQACLSSVDGSDIPPAEHDYCIGMAYMNGIDVEIDRDRALGLLIRSAEAGHADAIKRLVSIYRRGDGVEQDYEAALEWQRRLVAVRREQFRENEQKEEALAYFYALYDLYYCLVELRKLAESEKTMMRLMKLAEYMHEVWRCEETAFCLADCYTKQATRAADDGNDKAEEELLLRALDIYERVFDARVTFELVDKFAWIYFRLTRYYRKAENLGEARRYAEAALDAANTLMKHSDHAGNLETLSTAYSELGRVTEAEGKPDEAEELYKKAYELDCRVIEARPTANSWRNLSVVCLLLGNLMEREGRSSERDVYYAKTRRIAAYLANTERTPDSLEDLANIYTEISLATSSIPKKMQLEKKVRRINEYLEGKCPEYEEYSSESEFYSKGVRIKRRLYACLVGAFAILLTLSLTFLIYDFGGTGFWNKGLLGSTLSLRMLFGTLLFGMSASLLWTLLTTVQRNRQDSGVKPSLDELERLDADIEAASEREDRCFNRCMYVFKRIIPAFVILALDIMLLVLYYVYGSEWINVAATRAFIEENLAMLWATLFLLGIPIAITFIVPLAAWIYNYGFAPGVIINRFLYDKSNSPNKRS